MRKPIIAATAIVGTLFVLLVGAMFTLETRWFSDYLSGKLSESFGQDVNWRGPLHINWSFSPTVRVEQFKIDNPEWARHELLAAADEITARIALPKLVQGVVAVEFLQIQKPHIHLMESPEFGSNWSTLGDEQSSQQQQPPLFTVRLRELLINEGHITYLKPAENTDLAATFDSRDGTQLRIRGDGKLKGEPLQFGVDGDPLKEVVAQMVDEAKPAPEEAYALTGHLAWNDHNLSLDGTTSSLTDLKQLQFQFALAGPDAQALAQLAGADAYNTHYQLSAQVAHKEKKWTFNKISGEMGNTTVDGKLSYDKNGKRPMVRADLNISALDLTRVSTNTTDSNQTKGVADTNVPPNNSWNFRDPGKIIHKWLAPLREYEAQIALDIGRLQQQQTVVRELHTEFTLNDGTLTVDALRFNTGGGETIAQGTIKTICDIQRSDTGAENCGKNEIGIRGHADIQIEAVDLGEALAQNPEDEMGSVTGAVHAQLDNQALLITDSRLHYWDEESATDVVAAITQRETESGAAGVRINGDGKVNASQVTFDIAGGPLLDLDSKNKPYPVDILLTHGATTITAAGTLTQPLQVVDADLEVYAKGPDPAQLNQLFLTDMPHLPSYKLSGHFLREENAWYLRDIRADVGASDLSGNVRWKTGDDERLMVWADLHSQNLHLDTLTANNNPEKHSPQNGGASAQNNQNSQQNNQDNENDQVIPSEDLPNQMLQDFDAHIEYNARRVTASDIPLDNIKADLTLIDGVLMLTPLTFGIADGSTTLNLRMDTNATPAKGHIELDINRIHLNMLLNPFELADESRGLLGGRGDFDFTGDSLAQASANLEGQLHLIMNSGRLDSALVEALGLDAGELLMGLLGSETNPDKVQCAYAKLDADDGIVDVKSLTIATVDSNILGDGQANLEKETFELTLEAHPKDFSVVTASSPIRIHGSFNNAKVDVISDELVARGALAAIGAVIFPPAALLPLVEPGETEGVHGCEQAVATAKSVAAEDK